MKKTTLIEYGLLILAITFFIMSTWILFLYFYDGINSQMNIFSKWEGPNY